MSKSETASAIAKEATAAGATYGKYRAPEVKVALPPLDAAGNIANTKCFAYTEDGCQALDEMVCIGCPFFADVKSANQKIEKANARRVRLHLEPWSKYSAV